MPSSSVLQVFWLGYLNNIVWIKILLRKGMVGFEVGDFLLLDRLSLMTLPLLVRLSGGCSKRF